ncbi:hypothetical protein D3C72_1509690 [compost metagenome]
MRRHAPCADGRCADGGGRRPRRRRQHRHACRCGGQRLSAHPAAGCPGQRGTTALQGQGRRVQRQRRGVGAAGTVLAPRAGPDARPQPLQRRLQHIGQRGPARRRHPATGGASVPGSRQRQLRRGRHHAAKRRRRARGAQRQRDRGQRDRGGAVRQHAVATGHYGRRGQGHVGRRHAGGLRRGRVNRPLPVYRRPALGRERCAGARQPRDQH